MNKDVHVHVSSGSIITALLFILLLVFVWYIRDLVLIVLASIVIASALEPGIVFLQRHHVSRVLGVVILYFTVVAILLALVFFFVPPLLNDTATFLRQLPGVLGSFNITEFTHGLIPLGNSALSSADLLNSISGGIATSSGSALAALSAFFGGLTSFFLILILSFYFSVQDTGVENFLRIVTPVDKQPYVLNLWKRSQEKIGKWMQGQLVLAVLVGILLYLGLLIIGVQYALLLAVVAAVFELIPVFGQYLAAVPAIVIGFTTGGVTTGLVVTGLYLIVQQFEAHLIYPVVVKKVVGVPPILVILSMLIGFKLAGFLGALLAVPIATAIQEFISDVDSEKRRSLARLENARHEVS